MEITVKGKNMDVGEALTGHVQKELAETVAKYFERAIDATVTFSRDAHLFRAEISVHPLKAMVVQGGDAGNDAYGAFDGSLAKIEKQLRRYKRRIRDHHGRAEREADQLIRAQQYILAAEPDHHEDHQEPDDQPLIVAEMQTNIAQLTVGEAVMRMDLAQQPALMFRNRAHGGLNVVYRRTDGNIGWIDPEGSGKA